MFLDFIGSPLDSIKNKLDIRDSSDVEGTIQNIDDNIEVKGYNIWILVCAAVLASIGLDTNSTAVIIGAMLISPLMSPILGVGLGLGINDQSMFFHALRNLSIATIASLGTSALYFTFTPFGDITPEISGRTYPTLLDVGVALFGGIAGIVSGSRKEKTNAIPGVAIATALMPPLCSAGYGIAKLQAWVFFGAFYLFFINAVFISLSTYLLVRYLRFPKRHKLDKKQERRLTRAMTVFLIIVIIPSVIFLVNVWRETETKNQINNLIGLVSKELGNDGEHEILKTDVRSIANTDSSIIRVSMTGKSISSDTLKLYNKKLIENGYGKYKLRITTVDKEQIDKLSTQVNNLSDLRNEVANMKAKQLDLFDKQEKYEKEKRRLEEERNLTQELLADLSIFFPDIEKIKIETESQKEEELINENNQATMSDIRDTVTVVKKAHLVKLTFVGLNPHLSFIENNSKEEAQRKEKKKEEKLIILWNGLNPILTKNPNYIPDSLHLSHQLITENPATTDDVEEVAISVIEKLITRVTLTWKEHIDPNKLSDTEHSKLSIFLKRKLKLNDAKDSLEINHLVVTPIEDLNYNLDSLNYTQVMALQKAILASGNEEAINLIKAAGGADGAMGKTTKKAFALLNRPLRDLIEIDNE